ncbi:MAG: transporter substrate-binding domain-containing protein [Sneathiella sp.]
MASFSSNKMQIFILFALVVPALFLSYSESTAKDIVLAGETKRVVHHTPYVECAFNQLDYKLRTVGIPWKRAQLSTESGKFDGFFMATQNSSRDAYAVLSEPFFEIDWLYVVKSGSGISPADADFFQNTFAAEHGNSRMTWLIKKIKGMGITEEVVIRPDSTNILKLLEMGRVQVSIENDESLEKAIANTGFDKSDFKTYLVKTLRSGVYFSKAFLADKPKFLSRFNAAVKNCNKNQ